MVYPCDEVPKDIGYVHRNQSLLFRHFTPIYREPEVYVLTADSHRMGGGKWQVIEAVLKSYDLALAAHVDNLGTLNEDGLVIPQSAKVIFYPLPFCPTDETFAKVRDWIRRGGVLYLSGDISYDESHRRTRTNRLEELCGVRFLAENYPNIGVSATNAADQPCIKVEPIAQALGTSWRTKVLRQASDDSPLVVQNRLGQGTVIFSADPIELHSVPARRGSDLSLYRSVLAAANIRPLALQPDDPLIHIFRVPQRDGGQVYVFFNTDDTHSPKRVTLDTCQPPLTRPGSPRSPSKGERARGRGPRLSLSSEGPATSQSSVAISLAPGRPGLLWFDGRGALCAVETHGACRLGNNPVIEDDTGGIVVSLDRQDIRRSAALLLMPLHPGAIRLSTDRDWREATILTGDIHHGKWRTCERAPAEQSNGSLVVQVSPDQALSLLLLTESRNAAKWSRAIERAMTDPASLP